MDDKRDVMTGFCIALGTGQYALAWLIVKTAFRLGVLRWLEWLSVV